jgi:DNA topoisomerase-3
VLVEEKRQGPPKLHDLLSLQKLCVSRFGWSASKTLEVAEELYDGQGKKIITYPRAEVR